MTGANTDGARMIAACTNGDETTLRECDLATIRRELLRDPSAVNTTDEGGDTPLHRAAQAEDTADSAEFMKFLLDQPWTTPRFWAKHLDAPAILQALED